MAAAAVLAKKNSAKSKRRLPLEPTVNYSVPESAVATCTSTPTIWRAIDSGHLKYYRVGRRVILNGQFLLDWLAAGGKTSRTK